MYLEAEPKPGHESVITRSLSTVLGIAMHVKSYPRSLLIFETFNAVSAESFPPL